MMQEVELTEVLSMEMIGISEIMKVKVLHVFVVSNGMQTCYQYILPLMFKYQSL